MKIQHTGPVQTSARLSAPAILAGVGACLGMLLVWHLWGRPLCLDVWHDLVEWTSLEPARAVASITTLLGH